MTRSLTNRLSRHALVLAMVWALCAACAPVEAQAGSRLRLAPSLYAQMKNRGMVQRPAPSPGRVGGGGVRPSPNGANVPHRPDAQQHLGEWMDAHRGLPPQQQHSALDAEPGFRQLRPEEQQRMHNLVTRLNSMSPEQRQRTMARTEWMESLAPQQRQQVRAAMAQLGGLRQDRSYAVGRAFRSLQTMPPANRQAYMNSAQFRGQFSDQEWGTLNNLLNVSPLLPPANLGRPQ